MTTIIISILFGFSFIALFAFADLDCFDLSDFISLYRSRRRGFRSRRGFRRRRGYRVSRGGIRL